MVDRQTGDLPLEFPKHRRLCQIGAQQQTTQDVSVGEKGGGGRRRRKKNATGGGGRIIVGNSYHFIRTWSTGRLGCAVMRGVRETQGGTSEGLIGKGRHYCWAEGEGMKNMGWRKGRGWTREISSDRRSTVWGFSEESYVQTVVQVQPQWVQIQTKQCALKGKHYKYGS